MKRHLCINTDKTEEYEVSRKGNDEWKKCKLVGSLMDTTCDINRRRGLAHHAYNKLKKILKSKQVNPKAKTKSSQHIQQKHILMQLRNMDNNQRIRKQY